MDCKKVYNFKDEKVPDKSFTFSCKQCGGRIRISQELIDVTKNQADDRPVKATDNRKQKNKAHKKADKKDNKKKSERSLPKINADALKAPLGKLGGLLTGMTGALADRSERDWILTLTKCVVYFSIAVLIVLIITGGMAYFSVAGHRNVTYKEVQRSLDLKLDPIKGVQAAVPDIKLPPLVKQHVSGDHRERFVDWMNSLDDSHKADFIANLDRVLRSAQKDDPEHVADYLKEFGTLKIKKSAERPYVQYIFKFGLLIALVAMVALLGLFSLVLMKIIALKPPAD
jgi:hypothetical protein